MNARPDSTDWVNSLAQDEHRFVLRVVQPGLAGLMDGSVSTLAPIFATAFATHRSHTAFLIGRRRPWARAFPWRFPKGFPTTAW